MPTNRDIEYISRLLSEEDDGVKVGASQSQLSNEVALDVVGIVQDELGKLGCRLKNYHVDFTTTGFDITGVEVDCDDPQRVIDALKSAEPEVRHEFSDSPNKYAFMAANVEIARRVSDELGLDYKAFEMDESDDVSVSVGEPKEEKPLPPEEELEDELPDGLMASLEGPPAEELPEEVKDEFADLPEFEEGPAPEGGLGAEEGEEGLEPEGEEEEIAPIEPIRKKKAPGREF